MCSSCYSLKHIILNNKITAIGKEAFKTCHALKKIIIPDSVVNLDNSVFSGC